MLYSLILIIIIYFVSKAVVITALDFLAVPTKQNLGIFLLLLIALAGLVYKTIIEALN